MGIMSSLTRFAGWGVSEKKSIRLTDPEAFPLFGIAPSASGVTVTAASAMRVPSVRRAVSLIAESVATLPFKTYAENKEAAKDHPSYSLVHDWANDWTSAEELRELLTADALLTGHGFAQVVRVEGRPVELHRMDPGAVSIEYDDFGEPSYRVQLKNGGHAVLAHHDVLHIQGLRGVSPVMLAREAIALALAAEGHLSGFFKNGGAPAVVQGDADKKAFVTFLQSGQIDQKALTVAADAPAYVLAPEETSGEFIRNLVEFSPIRTIADVRSTASHTILLPKRNSITNAVWVGETTARTASEPTFGQSEITVKELATYVDLSLRMLEDSANVESEVRLALAEDFGAKEAAAFVNGDPTVAPLGLTPQGFMTAAGIAETNNGHATNLSPDALINLFYAMPATYRNRGSWVMNGTTLATVRKLKDGQNNYLWQPSYQAGQPETILGRPVVEVLDMPNVAAAATPIIFGDFKAGYRIYDRVALDVMPDLLTQRITGLARFHARRRVGAGVVRTDVFRKLKMAA